MAQLFHLSSSNVSDTFHKLIQTEGGRIADASGSIISLLYVTASHAVSSSHVIHISSSYAESASHATTAVDLSGLTTTVTELNYLDGITSDNGEWVLEGQAHGIGDSPVFDNVGAGTFKHNHVHPGPSAQTILGYGNWYGSWIGLKTDIKIWGLSANGSEIVSIDNLGRFTGHASTAGTVTATSQPNITSVGTLTSITSTGNSTLGNAITDTHTFDGHISASGNISASGDGYFTNIGIETDTPTAKITAIRSSHNSTVGSSSVLQISDAQSTGEAVGNKAEINFYTNQDSLVTNIVHAGIGIDKTSTSGNEIADLYFHVSALGGTASERMRIKSDGKVGIGTTIPGEVLTVKGNISSSGNILAGAVGTMSAYTGSFAMVSASGDMYAKNLRLAPGGAIEPSANNTEITIRSADHGTGDWMRIAQELFDVYINGRSQLSLERSTGTTGDFKINPMNDDWDVSIFSDDGSLLFFTDASANLTKMRGSINIGNTTVASAAGGLNQTTHEFYVTGSSLFNGNVTNLGDLYQSGSSNQIIADGNISASGDLIAREIYGRTEYWEATNRADCDNDTDWQGPGAKGIISTEDWNYDYNQDYDDITAVVEGSRALWNTGWRVPMDFSASIEGFDIYLSPNDLPDAGGSNPYDADFGFSCSLWYSNPDDLVFNEWDGANQSEPPSGDGSTGKTVQRHAATVTDSQIPQTGGLFKYNMLHISQSCNIKIAPGGIVYPRIKTTNATEGVMNMYWMVKWKRLEK
jgi:hypothetical protein